MSAKQNYILDFSWSLLGQIIISPFKADLMHYEAKVEFGPVKRDAVEFCLIMPGVRTFRS